MPIKAVLFDLDDTLWSIVPVIQRAENLMFEWLQRHVPAVAARVSIDGMRRRRQELMASDPVYQLDLRELRHAVLLEAFRESGDDPALAALAMEVFSRARNEVALYPEVMPALERLRRRFALGTISNGVSDLEAIGIAHFFGASIAAYRFGRAKPDSGIFLAGCKALGIAPDEALYAGDDPVLDVQGAQQAGMKTAWIRRPDLPAARPLPEKVVPDLVCADLDELESWLKKQA